MAGSPLIVTLDGATGTCAAALLTLDERGEHREAWRLLASRNEGDGRAQARVLLRLIDDMLQGLDKDPADLSGVVVGTGPGTFTGVRITVATARALALSLRIPVLGVSTLSGLASVAARTVPEARVIVPVVDARRGQYFHCAYSRVEEAGGSEVGEGAQRGRPRWQRLESLAVHGREELAVYLQGLREDTAGGLTPDDGQGSVIVVGAAALDLAGIASGVRVLEDDVHAEGLLQGQEALIEPGTDPVGDRLGLWLRHALGNMLGAAAESRVPPTPGDPGTPESVKPIYVRPPDADIHITKMRDPWASGSGSG